MVGTSTVMSLPSFRKTPEYQLGHTGELLVAQQLQAIGYFVLPSYDYSGEDGNKAPRLQGKLAAYVIPDLDVAREGKRLWVEVKTKTASSPGKISGKLEHGIPLRHLEHYLQVQRITGCKVHVAVYERSTGEVLVAKADDIDATGRRSKMLKEQRDEGGMVYFIRDEMKLLFRIPMQ